MNKNHWRNTRILLVVGLALAMVLGMAGVASAGSAEMYNLTTDNPIDQYVINGAIWERFQTDEASGTGVFQAFLRVQANGQERGYNSDGRPLQFDEKTAAEFTHSIKLAAVPVFEIEGVPYREFQLDINENSKDPEWFLSLDEFQVWLTTNPSLLGYTEADSPYDGSGSFAEGTARKVYDLDGDGNTYIKLDFRCNPGSGKRDYRVFVPESNFGGYDPNTYYVVLFTRHGASGGWTSDDGTEEWGVRPQTYATKSGTKWHDLNADGVKDAGEAGLGGWTIYVDYDDDGVLDEGEPFAVTASDGPYTISGIAPGTWKVKEVAQTGWTQSYPADGYHEETFTSGAALTDNDFGNYQLAELSGYKWNDLDGDGYWNSGEPALEGWTIYLEQPLDTVLQTTATDTNGYYHFAGLKPGTYYVREGLQSAWTQTAPLAPGYWTVVLGSGDDAQDKNFGNMQPETSTTTLLYKVVVDGDDTELPPTSEVMLGDTVYDTATVTSLGGTPGGKVQFKYLAPGDDWVNLGGQVSVEGGVATSPELQVNKPGLWYFRAFYLGDGVFLSSESGVEDEPLLVLYEELAVCKTVETSYTRTHKWDIEKHVETENGYKLEDCTPKIWLYTDGHGDETATWSVDVLYKGAVEGDFTIGGTITIKNTGTQDAVITGLEDVLAGVTVPVAWSWPEGTTLPYTLRVGEILTGTYVGSISSKVEGKNVINVVTEVDKYSGEAAISWGDPVSEVNKTVNIKDLSDLFGTKNLGTVTASMGAQFTYNEHFSYGAYAGKGEHQAYKNKAWIVETGQYATALLKVNVQQRKYDTAWRFGSQAHNKIISTNNWGWSDGPLAQSETAYRQPLFSGAGQNDTTKGKVVGYVDVLYGDNKVTVTYVCDTDCLLKEVHLWVGKTELPLKGKSMTNAPGQFPWPSKKATGTWIGSPGAYTGWTITLDSNDFDTTKDGKIYVAAHSVVGIPDPSFGP